MSLIANSLSQSNDNRLELGTLSKSFEYLQIIQRQNLIFQSDQGYQFTSSVYKVRLSLSNVIHSVSYRGSCVDNFPIES